MNVMSAVAGPGWGHMHDGGWMWVWGVPMMLFFAVLVGLAVWFAVRLAGDPARTGRTDGTGSGRARDILAERYAQGEISTEEYEERLAALGRP